MFKRIIYLSALLILMAGKASAQDSTLTIIDHVNVIPMTEDTVLPDKRVTLRDGKILRIESSSAPLRERAARTIDGRGKWLLPGLSEMHYHNRNGDIASDMKLLLANGITTVRQMSEDREQDAIGIREKTRNGSLPPLSYFTTGPYLTSKEIPSIDAVQPVVRRHKERGYDFLKLAGNLPGPVYLRLLEECAAAGIPVVGHAQRGLPAEYSMRMRSIEHLEEFVYLSKDSGGTGYTKATPKALDALARQLRESGVTIGTTLAGFEFITDCLDDARFARLQASPLTKYLSRRGREDFLTDRNDYRKLRTRVFDGVKAPVLFEGYLAWMKRFAKRLSANRVPLLAGSDTYGMVIVGFSLHRELELLQGCGIRPYDVLLAATATPARYLGRYAVAGTVSEGKEADLVLLDANPLSDIRNTKRIAGVFLKGKWMAKEELERMLKEVEQAFR